VPLAAIPRSGSSLNTRGERYRNPLQDKNMSAFRIVVLGLAMSLFLRHAKADEEPRDTIDREEEFTA